MSTVHFLNVGAGDCSVIEHNSGRVTMIDICNGYAAVDDSLAKSAGEVVALRNRSGFSGDFGMSDTPSNPLTYLSRLGLADVHRFILTHPDMDHMDGLSGLLRTRKIWNFWHTGVIREPPPFTGNTRYHSEDWQAYLALRGKRVQGTTVLTPQPGARFHFANQGRGGGNGGDGMYVLSPPTWLVEQANSPESVNDCSFVLLYRSPGGKVLFCGDAHDDTMEFILNNFRDDITNISILIAPHHGRHSGRSYDFLDIMQPELTLYGTAPSAHLGYAAWTRRGLPKITNNQAGNVVLDCHNNGIDVFVENQVFSRTWNSGVAEIRHPTTNYYWLTSVGGPNG